MREKNRLVVGAHHFLVWLPTLVTLNRSLGEESEKGVSISSVSRLLQIQVQLPVTAKPESGSSPELWGQAPQIPQASLKVVV